MVEPRPLRAVDTSVILRYFLNDVFDQARRARELVDLSEPLGITAITLAEVAWTLGGPRYRLDRETIANLLGELLARANILTVGLRKDEAQAALEACARRVGAANFGDALIAACARTAGLTEIYTFDAQFGRAGLATVQVP